MHKQTTLRGTNLSRPEMVTITITHRKNGWVECNPLNNGATPCRNICRSRKPSENLSPNERVRLAELLLESIHEGQELQFNADWNREVEARVAAFDRGRPKFFSAEDVFAEAKRIAGETSAFCGAGAS